MSRTLLRGLSLAVCLVFSVAAAATYSIPKEQQDTQRIYWGEASSFSNPAELDFREILRETPEYKELRESKVQRGSGKYWILMSQASERAMRVISQFGRSTNFDLIAAVGYFEEVDPSIEAADVTERVRKRLTGEEDDEEEEDAAAAEQSDDGAEESSNDAEAVSGEESDA